MKLMGNPMLTPPPQYSYVRGDSEGGDTNGLRKEYEKK
jgi:hypothetical protein